MTQQNTSEHYLVILKASHELMGGDTVRTEEVSTVAAPGYSFLLSFTRGTRHVHSLYSLHI